MMRLFVGRLQFPRVNTSYKTVISSHLSTLFSANKSQISKNPRLSTTKQEITRHHTNLTHNPQQHSYKRHLSCLENEPQHIYDESVPFYGNHLRFRILLIRHGESLGNADKVVTLTDDINLPKRVFKSIADHAIPLSYEGRQQAASVGEIIRDYYRSNPRPSGTPETERIHRRLWVSPYTRARFVLHKFSFILSDAIRETAELIVQHADGEITDTREHILLGEQQFGLFEGHSLEDLKKLYPQEFAHFTKCIESGGRFWARTPLGESRFDVAKRIHQAFGTFHRDAQYHKINDIIIVSHGVALRAFSMMWLHKSPEWFEAEGNPRLCSVRLLEGNLDKGYLFPGFKSEVWDPENETFKDY